jgi:hypothetical protein
MFRSFTPMANPIPKPITAKRSRKRAAALKVSEPSRKEQPAEPLAISHSGHGIAEMAQELADLHRLCNMLASAEGPAERARDEAAAKSLDAQEHTDCCKAVCDFEDVGRRANGMVSGLECLILGLEPKTPDKTLSLTLILAGELDVFLSNLTNHADNAIRVEGRLLEDALQAIIRGLVYGAGATSPLLDAYSTMETLVQWAERRSVAAREAVPYLVKYDPAKGCLKQVEGQP